MSAGDISIKLVAEGKQEVIATLHEVGESAKKMGEALSEHTKKLAELFLGYETLKKTLETFKGALELGNQIHEMSENLQIGIQSTVLFKRVFEDFGMSGDKVTGTFAKMNAFLEEIAGGGDKAVEKLSPMGITLEELQGLKPDELFKRLAAGIAAIEDPTAKSRLAVEVFGKAGKEMLGLLNNLPAALEEAKGSVGSLAKILSKTDEDFHRVQIGLEEIGEKAKEFALGALSPLIGDFADLTDKLKTFDAADYGKKFFASWDEGIKATIQALLHGNFKEAFHLMYEEAVLFVDRTIDKLTQIGAAAGAGIMSAFHGLFDKQGGKDSPFVKEFEDLFSYLGHFLEKVLIEGLIHVFEKISYLKGTAKDLQSVLTDNKAAIPAHMEYDIYNNSKDFAGHMVAATPGQIGLNAQLARESDSLSKNLPAFGNNLADAVGKGVSAAVAAYTGRGPNGEIDARQKQLEEDSKKLLEAVGKSSEKTTKVVGEDNQGPGFGTTLLKGNQLLAKDQFNLNTGLYKNTGNLSLENQAMLQGISNSITMSPLAKIAQERAQRLDAAGDYFGASQVRAQESERQRRKAVEGIRFAAERFVRGDLSEEDFERQNHISKADYEKAVQKAMGPVDFTGLPGGPAGKAARPPESQEVAALRQIMDLIKDNLPKIETNTANFAVLS